MKEKKEKKKVELEIQSPLTVYLGFKKMVQWSTL